MAVLQAVWQDQNEREKTTQWILHAKGFRIKTQGDVEMPDYRYGFASLVDGSQIFTFGGNESRKAEHHPLASDLSSRWPGYLPSGCAARRRFYFLVATGPAVKSSLLHSAEHIAFLE